MPSHRHIRVLPALLCGALCIAGAVHADVPISATSIGATPGRAQELPIANRVVVYKSERRMELLRDDEVLRTFHVSLGLSPVGHKEREVDFRTPEGRYYLTKRNARSDFFLSIQVSYPNDRDVRNARANGWDPGGAIMIHGMPNTLRREPDYYSRDWTDGCIALTDPAMDEIYRSVPTGTPILIRA